MDTTPLPVIVNQSGGTAAKLGAKLADALEEAFAAAGLAIDLHLVQGEQCDAALARAAGAPLVVVGGGDGTLGHAAGRLAAAGSALAILPLGTRNHLAGQLGIPAALPDAVGVIADGHRTRIDLGRAADRVFVNNASIGIYTRLVRLRELHRGPKWLATIPAAWSVLRHMRAQPLALSIDGDARNVRTPLLFIGNNRYSLEGGQVGVRESLSEGVLSLYTVAARTPWQLVAVAARVLVGRADVERDFGALAEAHRVTIAAGGSLYVALDGEVERMACPVEFTILPCALEVVVPSGDRNGAPAP